MVLSAATFAPTRGSDLYRLVRPQTSNLPTAIQLGQVDSHMHALPCEDDSEVRSSLKD